MLPYWLLFSIFAAGSFQLHDRRGRGATPIFVAAALVIALMVGLRYEVGGDWYNYIDIFDGLALYSLAQGFLLMDPGYTIINWVANKLGLDIWAVNLVCASIFTWGLVQFAKEQPNPWLACLVAIPYLVIVVGMGYTRQAVAIAFIMPALIAFADQRWFRTLVLLALAVAFHKSALVVLPLFMAALARNRLLIGGTMLLAAWVLYTVFLGSSVDRLLANYEESNYDSAGAGVRLAMNVVPALIFLPLQQRFELPDVERKLWRNFALAALAAAVALFVLESSTAVDRVGLYLVPIQLFVLSRLPYISGLNHSTRFTLIALIVAYSAIVQFVWLQYAVHAEAWLPYQLYTFDGERMRY